jgi:hypothetical protein
MKYRITRSLGWEADSTREEANSRFRALCIEYVLALGEELYRGYSAAATLSVSQYFDVLTRYFSALAIFQKVGAYGTK